MARHAECLAGWNKYMAVPNVIAGCFGSRTWMSALARCGGKATSKAKRLAARENGKRGGRPRKSQEAGRSGTNRTPPYTRSPYRNRTHPF